MTAVSLQTGRELSRLYADERPGGTGAFIDDIEANRLWNLAVREFYDLLVAVRGPEVYEQQVTLSTTANSAIVALPQDCYQILSLHLIWGTTDLEPVVQLESIDDRAELVRVSTWTRNSPKAFRQRGALLEFFPTPTAVTSMDIRYVPICRDMVADDETRDFFNGWERLPAMRVAADMLMLQRQPTGDITRRIQEEKERVEQMVADRGAAHPAKIRDVTYARMRWPRDWRGPVPPGST